MNTIFDEVAYNKLLDDMSSVITNPKDDFAIGRDRLKVKVKDPLVVDMINETTEKWFLMSRDYTGTESKVLQAIISRLNVFIFKIAGQMAVIDEEVDETDKGAYKSFLIKPNHVQYAIDLLDKVLIELRKKMSFKKSKEDQSSLFRYQKITNAFVEHNKQSVNKKELIALYLNLFKTNKQRAIKMFEEDYTNNLFITKKSKGGYQYKLNSRLINEYGLNMVGENEDDN